MAEERPGSPWYVWALLVGLAVVLGWWLLGVALRTLFWGVRMLLWAAVVGVVVYLVLTVMGKQPGRRS